MSIGNDLTKYDFKLHGGELELVESILVDTGDCTEDATPVILPLVYIVLHFNSGESFFLPKPFLGSYECLGEDYYCIVSSQEKAQPILDKINNKGTVNLTLWNPVKDGFNPFGH